MDRQAEEKEMRHPKEVNPTVKFLFRQFKLLVSWITDGTQKILILVLIVIIGGNMLGVNVLGLFKSKIGVNRALKANEDARLSGDMNRRVIHVQRKGKKTVTHEGVRKFEYSKLKDGKITGQVKNKGFSVEPGFVLGAGEGLRIGGDIQFAYWKRWGLTIGGTVPTQSRRLDLFRGHTAITYSPYFRFTPRTSIFGGLDTNKSPIFGIRTEF